MVRKALLFGGVVAIGVAMAVSASAKPKRCLTDRDRTAEQLVRHGVFLREASNRCEFMVPGTRKMWEQFDGTFGARLKTQTDARIKLFQREFPEDWKKVMTYFDGRMVTYDRNTPLNKPFCDNVHELLLENQKKGWGSFVKQAKTTQDEVVMDYKECGVGQ